MPSFFLTPAAKGKRIVLWTLVCFAASQLALSVYLDYRRPEVRDPLYEYRLRALRSRLAESPNAPLFLALGSSRIKYGLWPARMKVRPSEGAPEPVIYNFGLNGMGTIRELMYFRRLLADGIRPRWLLLEVWPPLWAEAGFFRESRMVLGEDDLHWRDVPLMCRYFAKEPKVMRDGLRKCFLPISVYRSRLIDFAVSALRPSEQASEGVRDLSRWLPEDGTGWFRIPWKGDTPEEKSRALKNGLEQIKPLVNPLRIDPRSDAALRELVEECRRRGIEVALILLPEPSVTRGWYPPQAHTLVHDYLRRLQRAYQLPIIDTRDWVPDEDFLDTCHIGFRGVAPFSERVGREVLQPLLQGQPLSESVLLTNEAAKMPSERPE
ncbi:MAG TPA: SGNH/GDSL hydrolase family protein [Gemmataceae bacterium]|jgi:hypothetical protein